jgi:hypothetical protein
MILDDWQRTWKEQETTSNGADDALCQKELVVLVRNGRHHYAKDVQDGSDGEGNAWAISVADNSCHWALMLVLAAALVFFTSGCGRWQ